jgi:hypothetical protein
MQGLGMKGHTVSTAERAKAAEEAVPGFRVVGSIVLNSSDGRIDVEAVEACLRAGAGMVWGPSMWAQHHLDYIKHHYEEGYDVLGLRFPEVGVRALDEKGQLKPALLAVTNTEPQDRRTIAVNAERVLAARLRDAKFFWESDRRSPLESHLERLDTLLFHEQALAQLKREMAGLKASAGSGGPARIDVATFKERFGVSRKFAIPLLEYLDRERVTRRLGEGRILI